MGPEEKEKHMGKFPGGSVGLDQEVRGANL